MHKKRYSWMQDTSAYYITSRDICYYCTNIEPRHIVMTFISLLKSTMLPINQ